ncbi:hypothetical protein ASV26_12575 [Klebsiella aerogenes]|nr:hypothetical protein ASV26_12575 [Klebsiella aerogenes]DAL56001.1 MAG TPA_asm: hypothetical protein [Caudoviricetes sp.]
MVRKIIKPTPDLFMTVGAINRVDVATRGIFSKGRTHVLDKLILCPVSRYFLFKFYVFGFRLGKFLYGGSMGFLKYVNLLADESDTLAQDLVALNSREGANSVLKRSNK